MRTTLTSLQTLRDKGEKIAVLTCYDASFAALLEAGGVNALLVGDSLGMVLQGHETTLPVTLDEMVYHTACVVRGSKQAFIITDMPFGTFQVSPEKTFENAARLMAAGAQMIKLEGGAAMAETISFLTGRGIPVCAHIGLTPQSVHQMGGYRVQGKNDADAQRLLQDAVIVEQAGAGLMVLEAMPALLAAEITANVSIPTIGIGAGAACSGQVLVLHDMLDIYPGKKARFVKNYMQGAQGITDGVMRYVTEVKSGAFPGVEHSF
ncbi:3-methyl-2-oxobutanoate hydroxymethyltransferase [Candidatus Nitrotoga sp. HW29]|uniref:3-methyl-2-oxobutanoate hydroxymethyltransferase n=1 Tax=Candidatus Nitrotoga sp. HW29 TaxID=2886963 RepID=UPI001EF192DE|nr:3-methyl-2-oxobutanoate hydroxymethyltransferase [Candidatus Nitrotoga sp. HW29]CAH1906400.1 3-methyl-2-oxobutanoate hydroxymethyltransferase [Candidatus Nitrotoga sp. HW29]